MEKPDSKVLFRVIDEDGSVNVETLWAIALGNDSYRLENSPFYAYGVSWLDEVYAPFNRDEACATFQKVLTPSGHKTIRIILDTPGEEDKQSQQVLDGIAAFGATYEGMNDSYFSIDIPKNVDFLGVCDFLTRSAIQWEHANPRYQELYPDEK